MRFDRVHIIEATFEGASAIAPRTRTVPPFTVRTLHYCDTQDMPDLHTPEKRESMEVAKRVINNLWAFEGHPIQDGEWDTLTIKLVDVAYIKPTQIMEQLTVTEIQNIWLHFCTQHKNTPAGQEKDYMWTAAVNTGKARVALLKEADRLKGFPNGGGQ